MYAFSCYISHKRGTRKQGLRYPAYAIKWLKECTSAPRPGNNIRWLIVKRTHRRYDATNLLNLRVFSCHISLVIMRKWTFLLRHKYPSSAACSKEFLALSLCILRRIWIQKFTVFMTKWKAQSLKLRMEIYKCRN